MAEGKKYFTVEEANRMLPLIRSIMRDIVKGHERLMTQAAALKDAPGSLEHRDHVEDARDELQEHVEELQKLGVVIKDYQTGLVDFLHVRDGRDVNLCWAVGEECVDFWHDLDAGFAGRKPL